MQCFFVCLACLGRWTRRARSSRGERPAKRHACLCSLVLSRQANSRGSIWIAKTEGNGAFDWRKAGLWTRIREHCSRTLRTSACFLFLELLAGGSEGQRHRRDKEGVPSNARSSGCGERTLRQTTANPSLLFFGGGPCAQPCQAGLKGVLQTDAEDLCVSFMQLRQFRLVPCRRKGGRRPVRPRLIAFCFWLLARRVREARVTRRRPAQRYALCSRPVEAGEQLGQHNGVLRLEEGWPRDTQSCCFAGSAAAGQ